MSEELVTIAGTTRVPGGKSQARKMRRDGIIPAVILAKSGNTNLTIDPKWLHKANKAEGKIFNLTLEGKTHKVRIQELQLDPVKRVALHVDLIVV
ncbi:MAG: hypothetical protein H7249_18270 [Chitinophagaceae bacterium]|nr:hypothetical protein [Oligoflexus sp.]